MHISMATNGGHVGRSNEDFVGAVPGAAVVLDGAGIPGAESVCSHGVVWYTHRLGGLLLGRLSRDDGRDLAAGLADAIDEVADDHRDTCDITSPISPQATVVILRVHQECLDYLVLADTFLVLDRTEGGAEGITDEREVASRRICAAPLEGVPRGTPEYDRIRESCARAMRARRNRPGGYWIAKDDPRAAEEAVIGSVAIRDLEGAALLSNGASRIVDPYGLTDWPGVMELLGVTGPAEVIDRIRQAEAAADTSEGGTNTLSPDDATIAHLPLSE